MATKLSGAAPPPMCRNVIPNGQLLSSVCAEVSPRSSVKSTLQPPRRKFMDEGKLSKVAYQDILKLFDPAKILSPAQNFIDIYLWLSGIPANGQLTESDYMRVQNYDGQFALLIHEVWGCVSCLDQPTATIHSI